MKSRQYCDAPDTMDIYSAPGTKVVFSCPNAGYEVEQETAAKHLRVGNTYTVQRTEVHSFHTNVYLREVPGISFNSVLFQ